MYQNWTKKRKLRKCRLSYSRNKQKGLVAAFKKDDQNSMVG